MIEKRGELLQKINKLTHGAYTEFMIEQGTCPDCLEPFTRKGTELVCPQCGLVGERVDYSSVIPFGPDQSMPLNMLEHGKGLGGTLQEKGVWCVLAHGPNGIKDMPIRARQTIILTTKFDHPRISSLLHAAQNRVRQLGLGQDVKSMKVIYFRNYLGQMIRGVGSFLVVQNWRASNRKMADACIALCIQKLFGEQKYQEVMKRLDVDEAFVEKVAILEKMRL